MIKINSKNKKLFTTSNLALVATLSLSFPIEKVNRDNPKRVLFSFKNSNELQKAVDAYFKDNLKVSPQRYFDEIKRIKSRIYMRV